ncbi:MAG: ABC transporter substrate-binding protein [Litorilinea sp.]
MQPHSLMKRRQFLQAMGAGIAASALAACAVPVEQGAGTSAGTTAGSDAGEGAATDAGSLEIFSWWTTGGEVEALNALYAVYSAEHPDVEIINAALAGGAGQGGNMKALLETRMLGGEPPDSFQVHLGRELIDSHVIGDRMDPLDELYAEEGFGDVFPQDLIDIASYDGHPWSVPVNIHRSNILWYRPDKLEAVGFDAPPATWDEYFDLADRLAAEGMVALGMGDVNQTQSGHNFESILLAVLGPEAYRGLFDGSVGWDDARVTEALEILSRTYDNANPDRLSVVNGDVVSAFPTDEGAAMIISGDWAHGQLKAIGYDGYHWAPVPGTEGMFMVLSDSFGLPQGAPNRENALNFLRACGSKEGQDAFNPIKGSIPARTDADQSLYDEYQLEAIADFGSNTLVPSIQHGAATKQSFLLDYDFATNDLAVNRDVAQAQAMLVTAAEDAAFGQ